LEAFSRVRRGRGLEQFEKALDGIALVQAGEVEGVPEELALEADGGIGVRFGSGAMTDQVVDVGAGCEFGAAGGTREVAEMAVEGDLVGRAAAARLGGGGEHRKSSLKMEKGSPRRAALRGLL
jgi:hypothetical protein